MQAIILAAGMGRRLGRYTQDNTKCMLPVNGIRLIDRMLTQLSTLNLSRVLIVVGYQGENLVNHIGHRYDGKLNIEFANNPIYDKTNNIYSLSLVKEQLQDEDTLLIESDLIVEDSLFHLILDDPYPNLALVAAYQTWMDGTMVKIDADNNIVNFVPKKAFRYEDVPLYYKTVNIYKFSREFSRNVYVPFLEAYSKVMGNNEYYEQVLRVITLLDRTGLKAKPIGHERWYEIDDAQDLDIAEALFSNDADRLSKYAARYGGYWRFPHLLDFCYLVNPYFPPARMKDELRSNFDVLLTQYPSGMTVNSLLAGKYFGVNEHHMVVGNGAAELIKSFMEGVHGRVGVVYPTFEEYPHRLLAEQIVAFETTDADLRYSVADLRNYFADKEIGTLLLVNPDNPSGNFIAINDVLDLATWCRERSITLVVDESFVDFTDGYASNSLLHDSILERNLNLVVVKSISKSYGVPGLRLGVMASGNHDIIARIRKDVAIWNINSFAEFYLQIFNKYEAIYREACAKFLCERERFALRLCEIDWLRVIPSQANYFLCEVTDRFTSHELTELLLTRHDILIKDCDTKTGLKGRNMVRIAIRDHKDNDRLIGVLKAL